MLRRCARKITLLAGRLHAHSEEMAERILIVEDQRDMANLLSGRLRDVVPAIDVASDGIEGYRKASESSYDLIVLDLMLPRMSGVELCSRVRAQQNYTPIIMLTAKSAEADKIAGLNAGADDYVTKPFSIGELLSRVHALLRRAEEWKQSASAAPMMTAGPLKIDLPKRRVWKGERAVELTAKEFDLLLLLAREPGRVFSRAELLKEVWRYGYEGYRHTVDTHVSRLRSKIETEPANPDLIVTVWGIGYRFAEPEKE